jgi:hypothetical protein
MDEADNVEVAVEASEAPARPEWLPEKFNTPEDLANSYASLESKLGASTEEIRDSIISEIEQQAVANRPESVGDYQVPESLDPTLLNDNELFGWWANHAYENGYSQEEFSDGISRYIEFMDSMQPNMEQEHQLLGENADARIEAVDLWSSKFFPEEYQDAILEIGSTAKGIEALEFIMANMSQSSVSGTNEPISQTNEGDLRSMMMDDRYWNPAKRDPAFVKKVQDGFSKLYR